RVLGHQECPGYSWKNCPGDNWNYKEVLKGVGVTVSGTKPPKVNTPNKPSKPTKVPDTYVIQEGDTFWSIAKKLKGISVDDIIKANPKVDPKKLKAGMRINLG